MQITSAFPIRVRIRGRREWEVTANGHGVSFWGDENVLNLQQGNG